MESICNAEKCTGCAACANICNCGAITMEANEKGFLFPVIHQNKCVNCQLCSKICPQNNQRELYAEGKIYAALARNDSLRASSSSGGIFSLIANKVLKRRGIVFGAALREDMSVAHIAVENQDELYRLQGSKYVQSVIGNSYRKAKEELEAGRQVLFSGTPCQIAGLKGYLRKEYENLLSIDLLCHGTPSPLVLRKFIEYKEEMCGGKIAYMWFRAKKPGWKQFSMKVRYQDGTEQYDNSFLNLFWSNKILCEGCYRCQYASTSRMGDITLGDFWGYKETKPEHIENDDLGISFVSVNTEKGKKIFRTIRSEIDYAPRNVEDALWGNPMLERPAIRSEDTDEFWKDIKVMGWERLIEKYEVLIMRGKDWMSDEDRAYYARPYKMRHRRHLIHCRKMEVLKKLRSIRRK